MILRGLAALAATLALGACDAIAAGEASSQATLREVTVLDEALTALREDFNAARGEVRVIFVAGPTCGPCLRGLADMNRVLGDELASDARLRGYAVYVPTLSAEQRHAEQATRFLPHDRVSHYWDDAGASGLRFQEALELPVYAWDIWLIYGPDAVWTDAAPPAPAIWMHQLGGLGRERFLDPEEFAAAVRARLEALS